ncbi:MAG: translation initiation factor IF-3 [Candidatus Zixiibacteriota bacterium]|nr:MAG: translation initiation factor IF-3 [candidate division Zixibacteria bacterium]
MSIRRRPQQPPAPGRDIRVNEQIRITPVRLIGSDGSLVGVIDVREAQAMARAQDLDLVEISPTAKPPVCKIMDFGKYQYEIAKKERGTKKNVAGQIKGIRLSPKISDHDFNVKVEAARKFLAQGNKVKISVIFRGRLITHKEFGEQVLNKFIDNLQDVAKPETAPRMEGARNMVLILVKK